MVNMNDCSLNIVGQNRSYGLSMSYKDD